MDKFKKSFKVVSKTLKKNEKEEGIKETFHAFLQGQENGMNINLHSDNPLHLQLKDELELKLVKYQKDLKE